MFLIKFTFYFSLSFLILSFPTSDKTKVFNHIDNLVMPYTSQVHKSIKSKLKGSLGEAKRITHALVSNTSEKNSDKITNNQSGITKEDISLPSDQYTVQEREALINILKQNKN